MTKVKNRINELSPCGVFCGACPSFNKSCNGCSSDDHEQKRISKFDCRLRICCYTEKGLDYCADCDQFPCKLINKKLINSHKNDPRYHYRHEIPKNFAKLKSIGLDNYIEFQKQRWKCSSCDGTVYFYKYKCNTCEKKQLIK